jgi:plastocyanin
MHKVVLLAFLSAASLVPALAVAADAHIDQVGKTFDPRQVTVKVGETVFFHNSDDVTHNINIIDTDDNSDDKGLQKPGEDIKQLFDKAGTFTARCAIHPKMKMSIDVK